MTTLPSSIIAPVGAKRSRSPVAPEASTTISADAGSAPSTRSPGQQRWHDFVLASSPAFRNLLQEQQAGWSTPELDRAFNDRQTRIVTTKTDSAFHKVKAERYKQHADRHLPRDVFKRIAATSMSSPSHSPPPTFFEIGCAPGGFCWSLVDMGWTGVACSLAVEAGGMPMMFSSDRLTYFDADSLSDTFDDRAVGEVLRALPERCDVVFCGAVMDQSQRPNDSASYGVDAPLVKVDCITRQLVPALRCVKPGGTLMFVYTTDETLFYVLSKLQPLIRGAIDVVPTMHPKKSPLYFVCRDVHATSEDIDRLHAALRAPPGVQRLDSMDDFEPAKAVFQRLQARGLDAAWQARCDLLRKERLTAIRTHHHHA